MIVAMINHNTQNTYPSESAISAFKFANPNRGDRVDFFEVDTDDKVIARRLYDSADTRHIGTIDRADWRRGLDYIQKIIKYIDVKIRIKTM